MRWSRTASYTCLQTHGSYCCHTTFPCCMMSKADVALLYGPGNIAACVRCGSWITVSRLEMFMQALTHLGHITNNSSYRGLQFCDPNVAYLVGFSSLLLILCKGWLVSRFQWLHVLRRRSAAARLLRLWVRIPPGTWMSVCCKCCVLSGRSLCDELITRPEESYRL